MNFNFQKMQMKKNEKKFHFKIGTQVQMYSLDV